MVRRRVAIVISGRGSNMEALIAACRQPDYPAEIVHVVSNEPAAAGLAKAAAAGVPTTVIEHRRFAARADFDAALDRRLREVGAELVCHAGFMRILTVDYIEAWRDRLINIHPSLLPAFPGLDTHARAIAAGVRFSGCTAHFVRAKVDAGPIIAQAVVPVLPDDDAERLAARVLAAEHRLYPFALRLVADGRTRVVGDTVVVDGAAISAVGLFSPLPD